LFLTARYLRLKKGKGKRAKKKLHKKGKEVQKKQKSHTKKERKKSEKNSEVLASFESSCRVVLLLA